MSFCGAIEMAGIIKFSTSIIKGGVEKFALKQPIFLPSPVDPLYSAKLIFEGISVDYRECLARVFSGVTSFFVSQMEMESSTTWTRTSSSRLIRSFD
jgi:hypothetical protein